MRNVGAAPKGALAAVVVAELVGAGLLYALLAVDSALLVVGVIAPRGIGFFFLERRPELGKHVVSCFQARPPAAGTLGTVIVLLFPSVIGSNI